MTPHTWDARQLVHDLSEVADALAQYTAEYKVSDAEALYDDPEYVDWANRILTSAGAGPVGGWAELQELLEWREKEGHDGWPTELCEPPKIIATCSCGQQFSRAHWQSLRWVGVMPDGLGAGLSLRDCYCGSTISLACRVSNTVRAPRDMADEQRAAKGAEVES